MDFKTFRSSAAGAKRELLQRHKDVASRIGRLEQDIEAAQKELAVIDAQMKSVAAFEAEAAHVPAERAPKAKASKAPAKKARRRGSRRAKIIAIVAAAGSAGVGRSGIVERLGIKDSAGKQSISNALAALKKSGAVDHDEKTGRYSASNRAPGATADGAGTAGAAQPSFGGSRFVGEVAENAKGAAGSAPTKTRKSQRRINIVEIIRAAGSAGIGRGDIIEKLREMGDAVADESAQQSVSNALATLKKSGEASHDGKLYRLR